VKQPEEHPYSKITVILRRPRKLIDFLLGEWTTDEIVIDSAFPMVTGNLLSIIMSTGEGWHIPLSMVEEFRTEDVEEDEMEDVLPAGVIPLKAKWKAREPKPL